MWRSFRGRYREEFVEIDTFTILTTKPNELVRPIHPQRMPVILARGDYETWLTGSADDAFDRVGPYPADRMRIVHSGEGETAYPVEE
jgi:putative SOS response-associated peptidase YedK